MNVIQKIVYATFRQEIDKVVAIKTTERQAQENKQRWETECSSAEDMIGNPVIVVTNQWEDLVIGFVTEIQLTTKAQRPMAVVLDELTGSSMLCFGAVLDFTDQRLNALLSLTPYDRWAIIIKYGDYPYDDGSTSVGKKRLLLPLEVKNKLRDTGFYDRLRKYRKTLDKQPEV